MAAEPPALRLLAGIVVALALPGCGGSTSSGDAADDAGPDGLEGGDDAVVGEGEADEVGDVVDDVADAPDDGTPDPCAAGGAATVETVAPLSVGRYAPAAAVLGDGRALIAGGYDFARGIQRTAELLDPSTGTIVPTGSLRQARNFPAVTDGPGGTVLVFGGFHTSLGSDDKVEVFDPLAGTFDFAGNAMVSGREAHTATRIPDGRVLVAGGLQAVGFEFHDTAELFDPVAETFTSTAPMNARRAFHSAVLLAAGDAVLLVGGDSGRGELSTAERYVIAADEFWTVPTPLPHAAKAVAAALLLDGRVLVAGGANATDGTLADASLYDPEADRFAPIAPMATRRMAHTLTRLDDGRVLAVGGWSDSETPSASTGVLEVFDPDSGSWEVLPVELARPRHDHAALLVGGCRVLVVGGQSVLSGAGPVAPVDVEQVTIPR